MISLVIIGAACSFRPLTFCPPSLTLGSHGYLSKRLASREGQRSSLKSPQSKWLNRLGWIRQITTQTFLQAQFSLDTQIPFCAPQSRTAQWLDSITEISLSQPSTWNCANPDVLVTLFYWVIYIHIIFDISCVVKELGALDVFLRGQGWLFIFFLWYPAPEISIMERGCIKQTPRYLKSTLV